MLSLHSNLYLGGTGVRFSKVLPR